MPLSKQVAKKFLKQILWWCAGANYCSRHFIPKRVSCAGVWCDICLIEKHQRKHKNLLKRSHGVY
jgi:hypothetical protein